jgi:LacI family transcriptional regulator
MLLSEIAKQASVSTATVSRAINQPEIVAPQSLARIRAVMEEHDYTPPPLNRRRGPKARERRALRLGVWFVGAKENNPSLSWFQDRISKLQELSPRNRLELRMLFSNSADELPRTIASEKLDGIIIQGQQPTAEVAAKLNALPCVWFMTRRNEAYPGDYVEPNNEENGRLAADYLAQRGHRNVAVLTTDPGYSANVFRVQSFMQRAAELGLRAHRILGEENARISYLEISPLNDEIKQLVSRLTTQTPCPSGIYLPVDHFAGAFFRALRNAGLQHGRDFEMILGNYNPLVYNNLEYHPAALDINLSTLVRKVIDHLIWRIDNPDTDGRISISVSPTLRLALD